MNFIEKVKVSASLAGETSNFLFCNKSKFLCNLSMNNHYCYSRIFTNEYLHQQYQFELTFASMAYLLVYTRDLFICNLAKGFYLSKCRLSFHL